MTNVKDVYDVTIVGAGPTGLFAAFCAGMREMKAKVIERLPDPGGQLAVLYPDKFIYDAPGHSKILAKDLVKQLYDQSMTFAQPTYAFEEQAKGLALENGNFIITTDRDAHYSRAVAVCAGIGAFAPKKLSIKGLEGGRPGVHYMVRNLEQFRGREVLIVGGGDTAFDWALGIKDIAKSVTLVHRSDRFRAHEASISEVIESNVDVRTYYELKAVLGDEKIEGARLYDNRTGVEQDLRFDDIVVAIGFEADLGELRSWGTEMDEHLRHISVNPRMETNIPGIYAAGDVTEFTYLEKAELPEAQQIDDGTRLSLPSTKFEERTEKWGLIVIGYAQAATAINHAKRYLDPKSRLFPGHSSEMLS